MKNNKWLNIADGIRISFIEGGSLSSLLTVEGDGHKTYVRGDHLAFYAINNGVRVMMADAYVCPVENEWAFLSLSGFNPVNQRRLAILLAFERSVNWKEWNDWHEAFMQIFKSEIRINSVNKSVWPIEFVNGNEMEMNAVPRAPQSSSIELGVACFFIDCEGINQTANLNADCLFRNESDMATYRMTPPFCISADKDPIAYVQDAIKRNGGVDLRNNDRWSSLVDLIIGEQERLVLGEFYIVSVLVIEGGEGSIRSVVEHCLPLAESAEGLYKEYCHIEKYNLVYSEIETESISKNLGVERLKGLNFKMKA